jgi:hypothetical protein
LLRRHPRLLREELEITGDSFRHLLEETIACGEGAVLYLGREAVHLLRKT